MTFLLLSIFLAIYYRKLWRQDDLLKLNANTNASSTTSKLFLVGSGISLGLAIFTKVPIVTMIPLVTYLVYSNAKSIKSVCFWGIPVFLIPLMWPAYAVLTGDFEDWKEGLLYQIDRGESDFTGTLVFLYQSDPILLILGVLGIVTATVLKKDMMFLLWIIPYVLTIYSAGGIIKYFHFIEIVPPLSLAAGILVVTLCNGLSRVLKWSEGGRLPRTLPYLIVSGIGLFGLTRYCIIN